MNVSGRYTYATPGAMDECVRWHQIQSTGARLRVQLMPPYKPANLLTCSPVYLLKPSPTSTLF